MKSFFEKEIVKRYVALILGLFFMGLGIAFSRHAALGVSPISSPANVLSIYNQQISFGTFLFMWNLFLILIQILILRRDFKKIEFLQIPFSLLFGVFADAGGVIANRFPVDTYSFRLMCVLIGVAILAFGIAMCVCAEVILNSGEAVVRAVAIKTGFEFGYLKIAFDLSNVLTAAVLSWFLLDGRIEGIREGTLITAVLTGFLVKLMVPLVKEDLTNRFKA